MSVSSTGGSGGGSGSGYSVSSSSLSGSGGDGGVPSSSASVRWEWSYGLLVAAFVVSSVATVASAHVLHRRHGGFSTRLVSYLTLCSLYSFAGQLAPSVFFIAALQPTLAAQYPQRALLFDADLLLASGAASIVSVGLAAALLAGVDPYRPTRMLYLRMLVVALLLSIGNVTVASLLLFSVQSCLQLQFDFSGSAMPVLVFAGAVVWLAGLLAVCSALFSHYTHIRRLCAALALLLAAVLLAQQRLVVLSVGMHWSISSLPASSLSYTGLLVLAALLAGVSLLWFAWYASFLAAMRSREAVKTRSLTLAALLFDPSGRVLVTPLSTLPSVIVDTSYVGAGVFDSNNRDFLNFLKTSFSWEKASPAALLTLIQSRKSNYSLELYLKFAQAASKLHQQLVGKEAAAAVAESKAGTSSLELLGVMFPSPLTVRDGGMLVVCSRTLTAEEAGRVVGVHNTLQWARRQRVEREIYSHYSPHSGDVDDEEQRARKNTATVHPYVALVDEGRNRSDSGFQCEDVDEYIDKLQTAVVQHSPPLPSFSPPPLRSALSDLNVHSEAAFVLSRHRWLDNVSAFVRSSCHSSLPGGLYLGLFYAKVSGNRLDVLVSKSKLHSIPMVPIVRRRQLTAAAHSERQDSMDVELANTMRRVRKTHRRSCRDEELEWVQSLRSSAEAVEEATLAGLPASTASLLTSSLSDDRRLALIRCKMRREADTKPATHSPQLDEIPTQQTMQSRTPSSSVSSLSARTAARPGSSSASSLTQFQADFYCAAEQLHSKLGTDVDLLPSKLHSDVILADGSGRVQLILMVHSAFSSAFPAGYDSNNHMFVPLEVFEAVHRHRWHIESANQRMAGAVADSVKLSPNQPSNVPRRSAFRRIRGVGAAHHAKVWSSLLRIARENKDLMHSAIQRLSEATDKHNTTLASPSTLPRTPHSTAASPSPSLCERACESTEALSKEVSPPTAHGSLGDDQRGSLSATRSSHSPMPGTVGASPRPLLFSSHNTGSSLRHVRQKSMMLLQKLAAKGLGREDAANGNHDSEQAAAAGGSSADPIIAVSVPLPPSPSLSSRGEGASISLSRGETNALTPLLRTFKQDTHLTQRLWTMLRRTTASTQPAATRFQRRTAASPITHLLLLPRVTVLCHSDHVDTGSPIGGEGEDSVLDDRDHWADADEYVDSDAEDEAAAPLEWIDRSRWIRHVILWKQEHDALKRKEHGKADKAVRVRGKQLRPDGSDSALMPELESSQTSDSSDDDRREESVQSSDNNNDDAATANERLDVVGAQLTDTQLANDVQQQQQQHHGAAAIGAINSGDIVRPSNSASLATASQAATTSGASSSNRLGRNLPSMILKHISAIKKESAEAGSSLSLSTLPAETAVGQQAGLTSVHSAIGSSEQSAASTSEHSVASLAPPGRHVRRGSKMDGMALAAVPSHDSGSTDKSTRHRTQRSVTAVRSASGRWPLGDLSAGSAGTPSFAQIASMGRSLLQHAAHDEASGDESFDIDTHVVSQTRGAANSARGGNTASRTSSASTAAASGVTVGATRSSLSPGQLKADLLASSLIRDRQHVFTVYPNSVPASELIDWLLANHHAEDREHACLVSKTLMLVGLRSFHQPHADASEFADDGRFYTFEAAAATKGALRMALDRPRDRALSTKQALAALVQRAAASANMRPASSASTLAGQVDRMRMYSTAHSNTKPVSAHGEREPGTQLASLQEVRVDGQQQQGEQSSEAHTPQPHRAPAVAVNGRAHPATSHHKSAVSTSSDPPVKSSSPPTATRPVFLRERKASSRWQSAQMAHNDAPNVVAAADSGQSGQQSQQAESGSATVDVAGAGAVHFHQGQSPGDSTRGIRRPSAHQRASTTSLTSHQVRSYRLTSTNSGASGAAGRQREAEGLSATQEALCALGVADLALVETQLAEQRQRDEHSVRTAARPAQLLPGEVSGSGDSHSSLGRQASILLGRAYHNRSPTQPANGVLNMARADSPSSFQPSAASSPLATPESRQNSLRNIMNLNKASATR